MSKKHTNIHITNRGLAQIPREESIPNPTPQNCKNLCPYGAGRPFCFPCYARILKEHREKQSQ